MMPKEHSNISNPLTISEQHIIEPFAKTPIVLKAQTFTIRAKMNIQNLSQKHRR